MIICPKHTEDSIGKIFTNDEIAYVGERFSQPFLDWISDFVKDVLDAFITKSVENFPFKSHRAGT